MSTLITASMNNITTLINALFSADEITPPPTTEQYDQINHQFRQLDADARLKQFLLLRVRNQRTARDWQVLANLLLRLGTSLKCQQPQTFTMLQSLHEWRRAGQDFDRQIVHCIREYTFTTR